ncbi:hypothetical protein FOB82_03170 [Corynebacterium xerosis]|uniref:IPT/TIG domain-containing protein n=2 Tax=Corynebacterium xerosis TaxID=1725 RepID=A0A6B8TB56_9CORY|nr:hypothetical protein FOB82_03170 [Corynebacterium xerosis]
MGAVAATMISTLPATAAAAPSIPLLPASPAFPGGFPALPFPGPATDRGTSDGPGFTLSARDGLRDDSVLAVTGGGYAPGENIYVTQTIEKPASGYPETYGEAVKVTVGDDGAFAAELPVDVIFGEVDCRTTQCYVATFTAFPKLADRSQDAWEPIHFDGAAAPAGPTPNGSPAAPTRPGAPTTTAPSQSTGRATTAATSVNGPSVTLSTNEIAASGVTSVTVTGTGFATTGAGVYVGVAEKARFSHTDASNFGSVNYVKASEMGADGSFATIVDVEPVFAAGNCIDSACAMFTFAAHGSSDRSQDTATDLVVAGTAAEKAAASAAAPAATGTDAKAGSKPVGSKSTTGTGSGQPAGLGTGAGEGEEVATTTTEATLAASGSPMVTLSAGLIGAVAGAALLGAGVLLGRRTRRADSAGSMEGG